MRRIQRRRRLWIANSALFGKCRRTIGIAMKVEKTTPPNQTIAAMRCMHRMQSSTIVRIFVSSLVKEIHVLVTLLLG